MGADEIVRKLAAQPAPIDSEFLVCRLCDVEIVDAGMISGAEWDGAIHDEGCPWRLAREYAAVEPRPGVWVAYERDWSRFAIFATPDQAREHVPDETDSYLVGFLPFGEFVGGTHGAFGMADATEPLREWPPEWAESPQSPSVFVLEIQNGNMVEMQVFASVEAAQRASRLAEFVGLEDAWKDSAVADVELRAWDLGHTVESSSGRYFQCVASLREFQVVDG